MWQTLRYALPAYLVPLAFVAAPAGAALLGIGGPGKVAYALLASAAAVVWLAVAAGGWLPGENPAGVPERVLAGAAGACLLWLTPVFTAIGTVLAAATVLTVLIRRRLSRPATHPTPEETP
jgi:TRAP-type uncharacterized transport system fused permease subunit